MVARTLTKAFRSGATMQAAADAAEVSARTVRRWLARGQTSDTGPHRALLLACQQAAATYHQTLTAQVGIADRTSSSAP